MAEVRFTATGLDGLIGALENTERRIDRDAPDIVQRAGTRYQERAKFFAPVDTGRLRGGIVVEPGGRLDVTVTSTAPYSGFVNWGTSVQAPQEFMGDAERTVTPEVIDEFGALGTRIF